MSGVLVVVEHKNGVLGRISLEALAAGQSLGKMLGVDCSAAVLGEGIAPFTEDLSGRALSKVFAVEHPLLKNYTADGYVHALEQVIQKVGAAYVLFPHTYQVRDFAPALATRFQQVLLSDVIAIHDGPDVCPPALPGQAQRRLHACGFRPVLCLGAGWELQG